MFQGWFVRRRIARLNREHTELELRMWWGTVGWAGVDKGTDSKGCLHLRCIQRYQVGFAMMISLGVRKLPCGCHILH